MKRKQALKDPTTMALNKAVIYCRVSSPHQLTRGDGLASQEATCRQYAERMGYEVVEVFQDNVTGGITDRPAMDALLVHLKKNRREGRIVIIDHLNRFARDMRGHWDLRGLLDAAGARLESPTMKFGDTPAEILVENVLMSAAQYQRQDNAQQTIGRMQGRLLNGFWPFIPPRAMRHQRIPGRGNVLVRIEPEASVIAEGLEAFARGSLRTQAELARWLNAHPDFGKGRRTHVTNQQAHDLLTNFLYAGVVERPEWGIGRRKGQHDGIISYETFERIQQRLSEGAKMPARADINSDFPLRGAVACGCCGRSLTACWATSKTGAKHPYYYCFAKGCERKGKMIRRDQIEGAFADLLDNLTPSARLFDLAKTMFRNAWNQRAAQAGAIAQSCEREAQKIEKQIATFLDRIVEASSATVITAYERRIMELERNKLLLEEKRRNAGQPPGAFDEVFKLAFEFLANPSRLWRSGSFDLRKLVLRLTFADRLAWSVGGGFQTPKTTLPFKILGDTEMTERAMAERGSGRKCGYTRFSAHSFPGQTV